MRYLIAFLIAGVLVTSCGNDQEVDSAVVNKVMYSIMSDDRAVQGYKLKGDTLFITVRLSNRYGLEHNGFNSSYKASIKSRTGVSKVVFN